MFKESMALPQEEKKFEVLTGKKREQSLPTLHSDELDEICNLDISNEEMNRVFSDITQLEQKRPGTVQTLAHLLAERNVSSELPIKGETFLYKRNISECKKLKMDAMKLIDAATNNKDAKTGEVTITEDHMNSLLRFLVIENRKAEWLEHKYYPSLFGEAVEVARAEVRQFMVKKKNLGKTDSCQILIRLA